MTEDAPPQANGGWYAHVLFMEGRPSATALRVALRRAAHQLMDRPVVFEDPLALAIIGEARARLVRSGGFHENGSFSRALRAFLAARSRFTQDALDEAVAHGVRQYVLLGAGLDTSAYRGRHGDVRSFEVDHPATQAWKRRLVTDARIPIPEKHAFVPLDFETAKLDDGLAAAGFDARQPAFFSWLGVVPYLRREAVIGTLGAIAALPAPAMVVFDYGEPPRRLRLRDRLVFAYAARRVARAGEPWKTFFDPGELAAELSALGFHRIQDLGPAEINALYFEGRADKLRVGRLGHLVKAER